MTTETMSAEKKELIESGVLSIGEPCTPYTLTKSVVNSEGNVEIKKVDIAGRKIPLTELRQRLLARHADYKRLTPLDYIKKMTEEGLSAFLRGVHHPQDQHTSYNDLCTEVYKIQHTRTLAIWHDHSTVLQTGYILFAVWVVYDQAVFLTEAEYKAKSGNN